MYESYAGVGATATGAPGPVWLRRLVPPWCDDAGFLERFQPIAQRWHAHPPQGVATLLEAGIGKDSTWVVQSLDDGEALRTLMTALTVKGERWPLAEALWLSSRLARAVANLHDERLVHGDVCPSTVLVTLAGDVQLVDVGIALAAGTHPSVGPARAEASCVAPEQLQGHCTSATDVYRLGLVVLELLTGRQSPPPEGLAGMLPERLASALEWLVAANPADRPPARDAANAVSLLAEQTGVTEAGAHLEKIVVRWLPERTSFTAPVAGGQELQLRAIQLSAPVVAPVVPAVPAVTSAPAMPMAVASPPSAVAATAGGVTLGRITPRRVTAGELNEVKVPLAAAAPDAVDHSPKALKVGEVLVERGRINPVQLAEAQEFARTGDTSVGEALISLGSADEDDVVSAEAELTKTPSISSTRLRELKPDPDAIALMTLEQCEAFEAVPLSLKGGAQLMLAVRDPLDAARLEALKALTGRPTVVAMRAGPRALQRTISRLYRGLDEEDPASWLESGTSGGVAATVPVRQEVFAGRGIELEESGSGEFQLDARGTLLSVSKTNATLDEPQLRLLDIGLAAMGERGRVAREFISLAAGLGQRLALSDAELGKVRYGAAALALANAVVNRPPWEPLKLEALMELAGTGWRSVEELVTRALEVGKPPPSSLGALALQTALVVGAFSGTASPNAAQKLAVVSALRGRRFPQPVLDALR